MYTGWDYALVKKALWSEKKINKQLSQVINYGLPEEGPVMLKSRSENSPQRPVPV